LVALYPVTGCGAGGGESGARLALADDRLVEKPARPAPPASELVRQGERRLAVGDPAGARPLFERAVQENPADARAQFDLGMALELLGDGAGAERRYRRAIELRAGFAEALNNLGLLLRAQGKAGEAVATLRQAVAANPASAEGHMNLALALEESGDLPSAESEYREVLRIDPNNAMTRANLGLLLVRTGKKQQAVAELQRALPRARGNRAALLTIGNGLRRAGDPAAAVGAIKEAIAAGGKGPTPALLSELALAQLAAGYRSAAIGTLREAIELEDSYAIAHYLLANMLAADGSYQEAISHYRRYLKLEPEGEQASRARERLQRARQAKKAR
jgi:Flp pilus assembly protein TadD